MPTLTHAYSDIPTPTFTSFSLSGFISHFISACVSHGDYSLRFSLLMHSSNRNIILISLPALYLDLENLDLLLGHDDTLDAIKGSHLLFPYGLQEPQAL